jgi:hypothetical protein
MPMLHCDQMKPRLTFLSMAEPQVKQEINMCISIKCSIAGNLAMNWIATTLLALAALTSGVSHAMTGGSVDPAFRGEWVPANATCASPLKLVIAANVVSFVNGSHRAEYPKLEQCFTCMGRDVENITLLSTDAMGGSPFMIYLDASKKKPAVRVDFSNDKKLGTRFPFGTAPLKKCA